MDIRPFIKSVALIAFIIHSTFTASGALADITNSADKFWINRTYQNLSKVDNFQAVTEQSLSNQKTSIISDVIFHAPTGFYQVITQPDLFKGFEVSYYDNTITLHDVSKKTALIITGLQEDNKESALDRVKGIYWYNKEHYEQVFTPSIHVADRLSVGMDLIANGTGVEIKKIEAFVDYHHSLFMQANFIFNNGIEAKIKNTKMSFNKSDLLPSRITLPKDTDMDYWDVSKKELSNKQISKRINKEIIWPEDLGDNWGFTTKKIFQQQKMNSALAYYHNDAFFLITVATPSNGKKLNEFGIPLPIENTQATLNQYPGFSNVEFNYRGFHYSLLSNIHIESLLSMAKGIASSQ